MKTKTARSSIPRKAPAPPVREPFFSPQRRRLARRALWACLALAAVFCAYRLATFRLLPLDSPGTMHEILWPLFGRFRAQYPSPEQGIAVWISRGLFLLFLPPALALLSFVPFPRVAKRVLCSRTLFFLSIAACLIYWRYPLLLGGDSNPDEAEFLSQATKLLVDPIYFRSIESNTSGPFNIFPLASPALFGLSPDYTTTRIIALLAIFLSIYLLHRALREMGPDSLARIAVLPVVGFFSLATYSDFQHYSSELIPMLVISVGVLVCARLIREPQTATKSLLGMGCLVSVAFFAKPQSMPILAAAAAVAAASVYASGQAQRWWRPIALLTAGFLPLQLLNLGILAAVGSLREFWMAYLVANWKYGRAAGSNFFADLPRLASGILFRGEIQFLMLVLLVLIAVSLYASIRHKAEPALLRIPIICGVAAVTVVGLLRFRNLAQPAAWQSGCTLTLTLTAVCVFFLLVKGYFPDPRVGMFGILAAAILGAAIFSVYASHQILQHYMELLIIPIATVAGWLLIRHAERQGIAIVLCVFAVTVGAEIALLQQVSYNFYAAREKMALPEGALVDRLTKPGSGIVVWGWRPEIYVSAGRIPATRDTNMSRFFNYGKDLNLHYQERFLRDLKRSRAELIVDALDTSCCYLNDRSKHGFELVPSIDAYIRTHYVLVAEQFQERFYLRRDLQVSR